MSKGLKRWCIKSRDGWCAVRHNRKPPEDAFAVDTRCGYSITLHWGAEERVPTCPDCIRILLPRTDWAKQFKKSCPTSYREALSRAGEPVLIQLSDETGELQWVVSLSDGFWMDAFPTEAEAIALVEEMGWTTT